MTISLLAVFLGGIISLLSPCSALILPGFLATAFHQRRRLILATAVFSLGVLSLMVPLGLGFLFLFTLFNSYRQLITLVIGLILIGEGLLQLFGRSLFLFSFNHRLPKNPNLMATFWLGAFSGLGASSCVGPILGSIITLAANSRSLAAALNLILAYSLGLVLPLFLLAWLWQRRPTTAQKILRGRAVTLFGRKVHLVNLAAAILFFFLGYVFIKYQGSFGLAPVFTRSGILDFTFDLHDSLFGL